MSDHSIRPAGLQDAALLTELGARTFRDTFGNANTPSDMESYLAEAFSYEETVAGLRDPRCHFWIAYDADEIAVGYLKLREGASPDCVTGTPSVEIHRIYVVQAAIGTGLGSALMQTTIAWAAQGEFESVWLGVWDKNPHAIAFYERWKFVTVGNHEFPLGEDLQTDLIMERTV